jgi:hypothetical protein
LAVQLTLAPARPIPCARDNEADAGSRNDGDEVCAVSGFVSRYALVEIRRPTEIVLRVAIGPGKV